MIPWTVQDVLLTSFDVNFFRQRVRFSQISRQKTDGDLERVSCKNVIQRV